MSQEKLRVEKLLYRTPIRFYATCTETKVRKNHLMPDKLFLIRDSFNVKINKVRTKYDLHALGIYKHFV